MHEVLDCHNIEGHGRTEGPRSQGEASYRPLAYMFPITTFMNKVPRIKDIHRVIFHRVTLKSYNVLSVSKHFGFLLVVILYNNMTKNHFCIY